MIRLVFLGVISGAFFSSTFILNEAMSLSGGHWVWSASLRYLFMMVFLAVIALFRGGLKQLSDVTGLFFSYWKFWVVAGSIGFGAFYALICFGADFAPGWVVASTWQFTVVASLFVLMLFGRQFPKKVWLFSLLIFSGVTLVNLSHMDSFDPKALLLGGLPVLAAAFCYPFGNQLVWEAKNSDGRRNIPHITSPVLDDAVNKVLLLTMGSLPLWTVLVLAVRPPAPAVSQIASTSLVALLSGVFATSIFLYARSLAKNSNELAGVDATQSSEVIFAVIGGVVFLGSRTPGIESMMGIVLILIGLFLFVKYQVAGQ